LIDRLTHVSDRLRRVAGVRVWSKAPLAPFTTIGVGGRAGLLVSIGALEALSVVLDVLVVSEAPFVIVGAGSNLLVADGGYRGVVVKLEEGFHYVDPPEPGAGTLVAGAGLPLPRLATYAAEAGLSGLEWSCGIPGSVGGGVAMNAGAHGARMADIVEALELVGPAGTAWVGADRVAWSYRHVDLPPATVVTAVRLRLRPDARDEVLARHRGLLRTRRQSQPRGVRTFGSAFKNPPGDSAGRLLDAAGAKGLRRGGAEVSHVHANFVANVGEATCADVLILMGMMREVVKQRFDIALEPEVRLIGAAFPWEGGTARS
jgi:UDP-N-acetylenolpyruvoylglucosamine reductase